MSTTREREALISLILAEGHEVGMQLSRNLGYYRTEANCECGAVLRWGEHDGDPTWRQVYGGHLADVAADAGYRKVEITDKEVGAMLVAIEVDHRYTPVTMQSIEDVERRACACGAHFLSAESHRYHVYSAALTAALGGEQP